MLCENGFWMMTYVKIICPQISRLQVRVTSEHKKQEGMYSGVHSLLCLFLRYAQKIMLQLVPQQLPQLVLLPQPVQQQRQPSSQQP